MSFERGCIWAEPSCTLAGQKAAPLGGRPGGGPFRDPNPLTSPGMEAVGENEQPLCKLGVGVSRYAASTTDPQSPGLPPYTSARVVSCLRPVMTPFLEWHVGRWRCDCPVNSAIRRVRARVVWAPPLVRRLQRVRPGTREFDPRDASVVFVPRSCNDL